LHAIPDVPLTSQRILVKPFKATELTAFQRLWDVGLSHDLADKLATTPFLRNFCDAFQLLPQRMD